MLQKHVVLNYLLLFVIVLIVSNAQILSRRVYSSTLELGTIRPFRRSSTGSRPMATLKERVCATAAVAWGGESNSCSQRARSLSLSLSLFRSF